MIRHILIPLDGTRLAESALPAAAALARALQARITLMHVVEADPPAAVHGERHLTAEGEAESYLEGLARRLAAPDLDLDWHVHDEPVGDVAGGIVAHETELRPDLVVMCSHGPARLDRLLRGSLAQRVIALGQTPLLLVQPGADGAGRDLALRRLLVPLDGSVEHEGGLTLATELAQACQSQLRLLAVVTAAPGLTGPDATLSRFMPGASRTLREINAGHLREYLAGHLARLDGAGLAAMAELGYGPIAKVIVQTATAGGADLIVLATHGKAGTEAFWANSVAARVLAKTRIPLLLIPVGGAEGAGGT